MPQQTEIVDQETPTDFPQVEVNSPNAISVMDGNTPRATWAFSADHVKQNLAHYSPRSRAALWWFFHYCLEEGLRKDDAAKKVGTSDTTLYRLYTDKYRNSVSKERLSPPEGLIPKIEDLKAKVAKEREIASREFVVTQTAQRIWSLCDRVRARNQTGILWGESHIGKTRALEEYARNNNHGTTKYVRMPTGSGKQEVARLIAAACGISHRSCYDKLKERIIKSLDATNLLIIDEFHLVSFTYQKQSKWAVVELLREIKDVTQCAMIAAATHIGRDDMYKSSDAHFYRQFLNRSPHKVELGSEPTRKDLEAFFQHFKFKYPAKRSEDEKTLREIGRTAGVLTLIEVLTMAKTRAQKKKGTSSFEHIEAAWNFIKNESRVPSFEA